MLTLAVGCATGPATCAGRVVIGHHRVRVSLPAGAVTAVTVRLRHLGKRVRVQFASAGRRSGRSVSARLPVAH